MATYYCSKCQKTMDEKEFYNSNNLEKYPTGKLKLCKKCITMHVDNWDPSTYLWILEECDVPYIPDEWNKLLAKWGQGATKVTGTTIIGRYLSKMKLKQYKEYRWKDNENLQRVAEMKMTEAMKRQGFSAGEIAEAIEKGKIPTPPPPEFDDDSGQGDMRIAEDVEPQPDPLDDIDLTDEERTMLRLKWGKMYRPDEWVWLEKMYQDMMASYDIQTAGHIDTLKLLCKTSLKANQLIDIGDVEGFQKMQKAYDSLMKSGKFTAAQNKDAKGEFVDSVSEIVALCEKEGFIPRYYVSGPQDQVDYTIKDMQRYTRTLITEEMHLGELIEEAIKNNAKEDNKENEDEDLDLNDDDSDIEQIERGLRDEDYEDYGDFIEEEQEKDIKYLDQILGGRK